MAGPGQHAGALEVTTGSLTFQHTEKEVVNIGTKHYRHFVSVMTDAIDGKDDMTVTWDPTQPRPEGEKHLSFMPEESLYGVSKGGGNTDNTAGAATKFNTACGILGSGLNNGASVSAGGDPWTLAFWSWQTTQDNTSPPGRFNGHDWFIMDAYWDDVNTWRLYVDSNNDALWIKARDNSTQRAIHNVDGVNGVLGNEFSDLYFPASLGSGRGDQWSHFAFVHDGTASDLSASLKLYINGAHYNNIGGNNRRSNGTSAYDLSNVKFQGWNTLTFFNKKTETGAESNSGCHRHRFDEMVMWKSHALSLSEIQELYNNGTHFNVATHSRYDVLTSHWKFDSDSVIDNAANPPFKMLDAKNSNHITSSLRFAQASNQQSRLAMTGSSLQPSILKGGYVSSSVGQWNSNLCTYGEYHYETAGGFTAGDLAIYTTAPFSGSVNYKVISRDHRDRGY